MARVVRTYWRYLKNRAENGERLYGPEIQIQTIPWLLPLLVVAALGLAGLSRTVLNMLLIGAALVSIVGVLFVGSAFAAVRIDRSGDPQPPVDSTSASHPLRTLALGIIWMPVRGDRSKIRGWRLISPDIRAGLRCPQQRYMPCHAQRSSNSLARETRRIARR